MRKKKNGEEGGRGVARFIEGTRRRPKILKGMEGGACLVGGNKGGFW